MSNKRIVNRWYCAILYPSDPNYYDYFDKIKLLYNQVTYILHNRDIEENGQIKKEHIHILFNVGENARSIHTIAQEIGITENYLQGCNKNNMLMYLIHLKNPEKTQYKIEEVRGELKEKLKELINKNKDNNEIMEEITEQIKKKAINSINTLVYYAIENKCIDQVRKNQYLLCKMIEERNITNKLQNK